MISFVSSLSLFIRTCMYELWVVLFTFNSSAVCTTTMQKKSIHIIANGFLVIYACLRACMRMFWQQEALVRICALGCECTFSLFLSPSQWQWILEKTRSSLFFFYPKHIRTKETSANTQKKRQKYGNESYEIELFILKNY